MSDFNLLVRGGTVGHNGGLQVVDIAVAEETIVAIAPNLRGTADEEIDATDRYVLPGFIDASVHFNEPGRAEWEGFATGSAALAAGGGTCFLDLPLHSEPPVLDAEQFRRKRTLAEDKSCLDFGLWGGLTPLNLDRLAALRDAGAVGFKAFLSDSGNPSFPRVDERTLREGMRRAAKLGLPVAVHPEDESLTRTHTAVETTAGRTDAKAWLAARPIAAELAGLRLALELAGETGCALHVAQVSSTEAVALIERARDQRIDVTAETGPHHLLLNAQDVAKIGAVAKSAPPIRDEKTRQALWADLRARRIHTVGSNHAPVSPELKNTPDFFAAAVGVAGCQHGFPLLFSACAETLDGDLPLLAAALSQRVAQRFRISRKRGLEPGADADFTLVRLAKPERIEADELWTRHQFSPYVGRRTRARITDTFVRGHAVYRGGRLVNFAAPGIFLRPDKG